MAEELVVVMGQPLGHSLPQSVGQLGGLMGVTGVTDSVDDELVVIAVEVLLYVVGATCRAYLKATKKISRPRR